MFALFSNKQPSNIIKRQSLSTVVPLLQPIRNSNVVRFRGNMFEQIIGTSCKSCGK